MVKLIRLITEDNQALFDNTFNEDILIPRQSKIALQSVSIETENDVLSLDAQNSNINFQVSNGFGRSFNLTHKTYTNLNYDELLKDIENNLNLNTGFNSGSFEVRRNYGLEWNVDLNNQKKVSIQYQIGINNEYPTNWNYVGNVERVSTLGGTWRQKSTEPNNSNNNRSMLFKSYISRGCSFLRTRTGKYDNSLSLPPEENGYIIGLSLTDITNLTTDQITDDMLDFGIAVSTDALNVRRYYTVDKGNYTLSTTIPNYDGSNSTGNDFQEVIKNFNRIELNIYQFGSAIPTNLLNIPYETNNKLYPFIIFRGGNVSLNSLRTIPSSYGSITQSISSVPELGTPPTPNRFPSDNFIEFSPSVAQFLGYNNPRQPQIGTIQAVEMDYIADLTFDPQDLADAFIIEMLNLKLESYDGLLNQRKNILAVVPQSNSSGTVIYETNTPLYIDLNNKNDILLRNLKIRIVKPDYSPVSLLGIGSMVILIET